MTVRKRNKQETGSHQVYAATLPVGCATGVVVDVNRVNNLALLEWLDRQAEDARTAE